MEFLQNAHDRYFEWLRTFKGEVVREWMGEHLEVPVLAVTFYLVMVLWVPKNFMKDRPAYNLKHLNTFWNFLLATFSITGAYYTLPMIYKTVFGPDYEAEYEFQPGVMEKRTGSQHMGICVWNGNLFYNNPVGAYVMLFILSKIPEMLDTAFLVFQKKNVIFLHWYHHITVMLYCWHSYVYRIGSGLIFAGMNYGVHSIMYTYYLICAMGYRRYVRPFAIYITLLQIIQMVLGLYVELFTLYHLYYSGKGCAANRTNIRLGVMMYLSYFFLFTKMFVDNYILKKRDKAAAADKKTRGEKADGVPAAIATRTDVAHNSSATNGKVSGKKKS